MATRYVMYVLERCTTGSKETIPILINLLVVQVESQTYCFSVPSFLGLSESPYCIGEMFRSIQT
jgi:hypothetical protein